MQFIARARYIPFSPYKLRPYVDVVRGKNAAFALGWLETRPVQRAKPLQKALASAVANAKSKAGIEKQNLIVKTITVDQGPMYKYVKPGPMGRASVLRRRFCHINVVLEEMKS